MDVLLKTFLRKEADLLNQQVKELMNSQTVYQVEDDIGVFDNGKTMQLQNAVRAVEKWLRAVGLCSLLENRSKTSELISLTMPADELNVGMSMDGVYGDYFGDLRNDVHTPIGSMSPYVCEAIVNVEENPVLLLYQFFDEQIRKERRMIVEKGGNVSILSSSILEEYGIVDVLGVYRLDSLMEGINKFLHPDCAGAAPNS